MLNTHTWQCLGEEEQKQRFHVKRPCQSPQIEYNCRINKFLYKFLSLILISKQNKTIQKNKNLDFFGCCFNTEFICLSTQAGTHSLTV